MTNTETIYSPAKINRNLYIKRFSEEHQKHELESIMQKISLCDVIKISEISSKNQKNILTVTGKFSEGVPSDERNIIIKATEIFFEKYKKIKKQVFSIRVEKNIPNKAGLGGGSSNAAEIIKFFHKKYSVPLVPAEYISLGSDVPFFLENFSIGKLSGKGEKITQISPEISEKYSQKFGILIFPQNISISTQWAFEEYKKNIQNKNGCTTRDLPQKENVLPHSHNDFTEILCENFPEISGVLSLLREISEENKISEYGISGSGSTIYTIFESKTARQKFLENFQKLCSIPTTLQKFEPLVI